MRDWIQRHGDLQRKKKDSHQREVQVPYISICTQLNDLHHPEGGRVDDQFRYSYSIIIDGTERERVLLLCATKCSNEGEHDGNDVQRLHGGRKKKKNKDGKKKTLQSLF